MNPHKEQLENVSEMNEEGSISLGDIFLFLKDAYKTIVFTCGVGLVGAIVYIALAPKVYSAKTQIIMGKIGDLEIFGKATGSNIEEPIMLVARLTSTGAFPPQVFSACGVDQYDNPRIKLLKLTKFKTIKGVSNAIEMVVLGNSPLAVQSCSYALYEFVKDSQAQVMAPYLAQLNNILAEDKELLIQLKGGIKNAGDRDLERLLYLDAYRSLQAKIQKTKELIDSSSLNSARLSSPIYVDDIPYSPKKLIAFFMGTSGGITLGLLIAFIRKLKVNPPKVFFK